MRKEVLAAIAHTFAQHDGLMRRLSETMNGNVVDFASAKEAREPHNTGKARCIDCKHEWVAVAPVGTVWLICPACVLERGRFIYQHQREGAHWTCHCNNDLFYVTPEGCYCPNCGEWQKGF